MPNREPRETISTYLDCTDAELLRARAKASERTIAAEVRVALRDYLKSSGAASRGGSTDEQGGAR